MFASLLPALTEGRPMRAAVVREHGGIDNILLEDDFPEPELERQRQQTLAIL